MTIAVFMLSLSEPALRIPLMALTTFGAMFLSRAATLGPAFFTVGFIITYGLTLGDQLLGLALAPATAADAPQLELPEIIFVSPEEALLRFILWMSLAAAVPLALLIAANLLTGRDPARIVRQALVDRLAAAARFCADEKGAERRLEAQAFEGTAELRKLQHLAGLLRRGRRGPTRGASLIDDIGRLVLLLLAWLRIPGNTRKPLAPAAGVCRAAERALDTGEAPSARTGRHRRDRRRTTAGGCDLAHAEWDLRGIDANTRGGAPETRQGRKIAAAAVGTGCIQQPGVCPLRPEGHAGGDVLLSRPEPHQTGLASAPACPPLSSSRSAPWARRGIARHGVRYLPEPAIRCTRPRASFAETMCSPMTRSTLGKVDGTALRAGHS